MKEGTTYSKILCVERPSFPTNFALERFDGSRWRVFALSGGSLVITTAGQELFHQNRQVGKLLLAYKDEILDGKSQPSGVRQWFKHGANSDVYEVGSQDLAMKEASTSHSVFAALERMDCLYSLCQSQLPDFVRVVEHYGAVFFRDYRRQFLLMRKIDEGITVADVIAGSWDGQTKAEVQEGYNLARVLIDDAMESGVLPVECQTNLLPDWQEGNVLVDFSQRSQRYPFTLQIIDQ